MFLALKPISIGLVYRLLAVADADAALGGDLGPARTSIRTISSSTTMKETPSRLAGRTYLQPCNASPSEMKAVPA